MPFDTCLMAYWYGLDEFLCDVKTTRLREIHFVNIDAEVTASIQNYFSKNAKAWGLTVFTVLSDVTNHQPVQPPHSSRSVDMKYTCSWGLSSCVQAYVDLLVWRMYFTIWYFAVIFRDGIYIARVHSSAPRASSYASVTSGDTQQQSDPEVSTFNSVNL